MRPLHGGRAWSPRSFSRRRHSLIAPLFSKPYEMLLPQPIRFDNLPNCRGVDPSVAPRQCSFHDAEELSTVFSCSYALFRSLWQHAKTPSRLFSVFCALFCKDTGGGYPPLLTSSFSIPCVLCIRRSARVPRQALAFLAGLFLALLPLSAQNPPPQRPRLVVVIVVDQMRADYIDRFRDRWHGGLRRLVDQGAWLRNAAYPYADTETCPSHATISTGVFPATHGIVDNTWWDRRSSARVTCTQDASARNSSLEETVAPGDSPARLRVPSFAEQLRADIPGSRVVTMAEGPRGDYAGRASRRCRSLAG